MRLIHFTNKRKHSVNDNGAWKTKHCNLIGTGECQMEKLNLFQNWKLFLQLILMTLKRQKYIHFVLLSHMSKKSCYHTRHMSPWLILFKENSLVGEIPCITLHHMVHLTWKECQETSLMYVEVSSIGYMNIRASPSCSKKFLQLIDTIFLQGASTTLRKRTFSYIRI